jgi:hypothetical protein
MSTRLQEKAMIHWHPGPTLALTIAGLLGFFGLFHWGQRGDQRLWQRYPQVVGATLEGPAFLRTERGFATAGDLLEGPRGAAPAPSRASTAHPLLAVSLPRHGRDAFVFSMGSFSVRVHERGLVGHGHGERGAVVYEGRSHRSYWEQRGAGFQEWIEVEAAGDGPVASWELEGGTLVGLESGAAVLDDSGRQRLAISAPRAFERGGREARAWFTVEGSELALHTDARGPALIDPTWQGVDPLLQEWRPGSDERSGECAAGRGGARPRSFPGPVVATDLF